MTALALARRDILGHKISLFSAIAPAIVLHSMASFRGVKPMYVWSSRRPWDEIQLQAWNAADGSAPQQLLLSGGMNLLWFGVILRSLSTCVNNFFILRTEFIKAKKREQGQRKKEVIF
jgi:hypothetical protein